MYCFDVINECVSLSCLIMKLLVKAIRTYQKETQNIIVLAPRRKHRVKNKNNLEINNIAIIKLKILTEQFWKIYQSRKK